ncbi:Six-hairpin glycosidase [Mycena sanguinolenta]|uniref:Six-hairpin glycosidase n=1 Tax=Mycena sanguinolenta TaxID=230812 RepID=A0A8H7CPI7_9AGAR|nr:Six-hairpin glycosidase [Mycena sanguinolenta]
MPGAVASSLLFLSLFALESSAVQFTFQVAQPKAATANSANNNLINTDNLRYSTNITISGNVVNVLIDTGSSDLWVMPLGDIGVGAFSLDGGQFAVSSQAYLFGQTEAGEEADFEEGHFGILGLGFDTQGASQINTAVQQAQGATATWGQSVLTNIFAQNPDSSDYIGIALSRTGDQEGTADGSLTIAERLRGRGCGALRWIRFRLGGTKINWPSTITAAPAGKNIVLLDTGTTNILMPQTQVNAIYSTIPGAVLSPNSNIPLVQFSETNNVWVVPCTAQVDVVATFAGQDFAIHPLDVTDMQVLTTPDGKHNFTVCVNSFTDIGTIAQGETDALFGDSFLRNVYTAFDFGTGGPTKGTPFVQMLSTTDATKSAADLIAVRAVNMQNMPPELSPVDLVRVFNGTLNAADAVPVAALSASVISSAIAADAAASTTAAGGSASTTAGSSTPATTGSSGSGSSGSTNASDGKSNGAGMSFVPQMGVVVGALLLGLSTLL